MTPSWNHELLDQLDFAWNVQFMPRMEDLTDAEYLWEPVDGCLTVRPAGDGTFRLDANVRASPPPFTTIAWRIGHMASVFGRRASNHFGDASFDEASVRWPGTASGALEILIGEYGRWHAGVVTWRPAYVQVETASPITRGVAIADLLTSADPPTPNALIATDVDVDRFLQLFLHRVASLG